jgi:hypothetical protein
VFTGERYELRWHNSSGVCGFPVCVAEQLSNSKQAWKSPVIIS